MMFWTPSFLPIVAFSMMQKLERNQTVILISGLGGLCDLAVDALSNTGSRKLNSENPGLCERLAAIQKRENLHLVDLLTKDSHKQVYEVGSKLLSPDKRIKLGKIKFHHITASRKINLLYKG